MVKKQFRSMKVQGLSGYKYKETPGIMLKGQWLKEAGFEVGKYVQVKCEDGKLIISLDEDKEKLIEAEKLFVEHKKKVMYEEIQKEKDLFCTQYVAEQKAGYR